jgi:hypothetical protein
MPTISTRSFASLLASVSVSIALSLVMSSTTAAPARADEITDWNQTFLRAGLITAAPNYVIIRDGAIVQGAMFDAINGIERRYTPLHVDPAGPADASARAAAVQAAYTTLLQLFPTQKQLLDAQRFASLADIATRDDPAAIASGIAWGQTVATSILDWRSTDGWLTVLPPFTGGTAPGVWRPTPPAFLPGATPQLATATPFVIASNSQFRPAGFPALTSDE